ncbi:MAG: exo-alpha-sialidase [Chloroflexi bacterium]|nr:exo-alpha-sialidase [Ktedonobacteraceae bacterium]MBV9708298.1 exo-alpha-sialidase [Chloroflexota bacterium]
MKHNIASYITQTFVTYCVIGLLALVLASCGSTDPASSTTATTPTQVAVNGFGPSTNHVHSLLALPGHILLLAAHYGTFRSADGGATWQQVSGGSHQLMQGLMDYSLVGSPLDSQRFYMLTQVAVNPHPGTLGLYTSADQGRSWKLAIPTANLTSGTIFFVAAGNDTPQEVYVYLQSLGALGLKVSLDAGQHFSSTGTLPFGLILGMLAIPDAPGHLLAYGSDGMASSNDGGIHWQVMRGITGGIFSLTTAGPHKSIYASGDSGVYVSNDEGATFTLVHTLTKKEDNPQAAYGTLTVSPTEQDVLYSKTGTAVYRSSDGGRTWQALPHISGNLTSVAIDPLNASQVYLSLSYPTEVYRFNKSSGMWSSLTPKA